MHGKSRQEKERGFCYDRNEIYISEATAVCGCFGFYSRADLSASYPDCNGTYEEQKTEKYAGRTDGRTTAFGQNMFRLYGGLYGYHDAENEWTGCRKDNQGNEKKGCHEGSDHCNISKCLCRRYYQQPLAGMNVHLAKPLDAEKVIVALKQCMADNSDVKLHEDL